jgi:hypothetical protein
MTLDDQQTAALDMLHRHDALNILAAHDAAEELVTMHRAQDINLAQHPRLAAFVTTWHGGWERDETDEADDQHSERADQEAWT